MPTSKGHYSLLSSKIDTRKGIFGLKFTSLIFSVFIFGSIWLFADHAKADFRVCNDTKSLVGVSLGYNVDGKWTTEGWWQIPGDTCSSLLEGELNAQFYYIYAEDADRGGQWRGEVFMCTADQEFKIDGVQDCFTRGFQKTGFFEINTNNRDSWMVRLTEDGQTQQQ